VRAVDSIEKTMEGRMARARITTVMFNSENPEELVEFWCKVLGVEAHPHDHSTEHIWLFPTPGESFKLGFQRVAKKLSESQEVHIDVAVDDLEEAEMIVRENGGSHLRTFRTSGGFEWRILKDPQGNSFCIFRDAGH
jgi:predicted enzyme related to lactoylglutathione lyase